MPFSHHIQHIAGNLSNTKPEPPLAASSHQASIGSHPQQGQASGQEWSTFGANTAHGQTIDSNNTMTGAISQPHPHHFHHQHSAGYAPHSSLAYSSVDQASPLPSSSSFGGFNGAQRGGESQSMQAVGGAGAIGSYTHRRTHTATSLNTVPPNYYPFVGAERVGQPPTPSTRPSSLGPVRVHQHFPTTGESGVPVTFLLTVQSSWATGVGLQLKDGRFGSAGAAPNSGVRASSHLVISFGGIDVDTRAERTMAGVENASFGTLDGQHQSQSSPWSSVQAQEVDITVVAHAPAFPGSSIQGGRVPIRIRLVGPLVDPMVEVLSAGFELGEFCYGQVSPKGVRKRPGEQLADEHSLRRPASFPNFGSTVDSSRFLQQPYTLPRRRGAADGFEGMQRAGPSYDARPMYHRSTLSGSSTDPATSSDTPFSFSAGPPTSSPSLRPANEAAAGRPGRYYGQEVNVPPRPSTGDGPSSYPQLVRASQLYQNGPPAQSTSTSTPLEPPASSSSSSSPPENSRNLTQRANLQLHGNLTDMALGWSHDEWRSGRRLVQFWRKQEGATIHAVCKPILPEQYVPNSIVVSCIFWEVTNECYITSVDIIYLLEALVASRFNVEEKNRIRRNLEGLKPKTISKIGKSNDDRINRIHEEFFKLVMSFPNPRPRHIEKDIKIFPWRALALALNKIILKYSTAPTQTTSSPEEGGQRQQQTLQRTLAPVPPQVESNRGVGGGSSEAESHLGPLSIDVAASNAYKPLQASSGSASFHQQRTPSSGALSSSAFPGHSTHSSPRKQPGSAGHPHFNFSDFVVSPVAFGQTPLQQSQQSSMQLSQHGPPPPSQNQQSSFNTAPGGLGMDLGTQRRE